MLYDSGNLVGDSWEKRVEDAGIKAGLDVGQFWQCLGAEETQEELQSDISEALRLGMRGTPTFVIDGQIYVGMVDAEFLRGKGIILPGQ